MADKVTKICMDIHVYRKLEKSRVLNIIERLQIPNILETCYLYNLQWKYVKKYISIQASIFLFVSSVLKLKKYYTREIWCEWKGMDRYSNILNEIYVVRILCIMHIIWMKFM
jgi:hypothetical protein